MTNAAVLNQCWMEGCPAGNMALPMILGLQLLPSALISAHAITTLKGDPVCAVITPLTCHPPRIPWTTAVAFLEAPPWLRPNGISQTALPAKRCVRSKLDGPRSGAHSFGFCGY